MKQPLPEFPGKSGGQPRVPISTISSAPQLLADVDVNPATVASTAGLDPSWFSEPTQTLSFEEIGLYLRECVRVTRDDSFPIRLGLAEGLAALTALGYLVQNLPNVRAALATLCDHVHHFAGAIEISEQDDLASLEYWFLLPSITGAELIEEAGMGIGVATMRQLCGPAWQPIELQLVRHRPVQASVWQQCVRVPVRFGAKSNLLVFSSGCLEHQLEHSNAAIHHLLLDIVTKNKANAGNDFALHVSAAIRESLMAGDMSVQQIAARFGMSTRTLRRRLSAQGTSLEALQERVRFQVACDLLDHPTVSITQIADLLGYAHSSALTRAFRRWTSMSPREWRNQPATDCNSRNIPVDR